MTTRAVLLAAGEGTRAWPLTATRSKPLLPVAGETLLARLIRQASQAGIEHVTVVAASDGDQVAEHARTLGSHLDLRLDVAVQQEPRGTGHALQQAELGAEPALVANGDVVLPEGALASFLETGPTALAATRVDDVSAYGSLDVSDDRLVAIQEKPKRAEAGLANAGVYLLDAETRGYLDAVDESPRGEIELTDAIEAALGTHEEVRVHTFADWLDVGWPWDLLQANAMALAELQPRLDGHVEEGARIQGPVRVEEGAKVRSGAVIEGPVLVREGATVGPNAYVRGATTIGPQAKVGHACEVKNTILMAEAKVPHVSYVGDSVLGRDTNLGAGTQVANLRHDEANVHALTPRGRIDTGRRKFGVALGDGAKTGINATLNVGTLLGPEQTVKPGETVYGSRLGEEEG